MKPQHPPDGPPLAFAEPFGVVLRRLRKSRQLHQLTLAVEIPVDHTLVSRWETGAVLPTAQDVRKLETILELSHEEAEELRYAWRRHRGPADGELADSAGSHGVDDWINFLQISVDCARTLRKAGQPRTALILSSRDAVHALRGLRAQSWTTGHQQALIGLAELLLEQCKAGLDYLPRNAVRRGDLGGPQRSHKLVADAAGPKASVFHMIATEAIAYVSGNVGDAYELSLTILDQQQNVPSEWLPEVVRACAINSGRMADADTLTRTESALLTLCNERDDIAPGTHAFVLEGIARGWGGMEAKGATDVLEQAWALRERSDDSEANSALRYVQLVRTQAEVDVALRASGNAQDTCKKIENALHLSRREGYDRYISQLERLGEQVG